MLIQEVGLYHITQVFFLMNFGMYPNPEISLKFHISKQSMFRITSITEKTYES